MPSFLLFSDYDLELTELLPEEISLFAMCKFSFFNLKDWWDATDTTFIDVTVEATNGVNLLALTSSVEICKLLIQKIDVNKFIPGYGSALIASIEHSNLELTRFLVEEGGANVDEVVIDPDWDITYSSALAAAVGEGNLETVDFLIQTGKASVDLLLKRGAFGSALITAAELRLTDIGRYLLMEAKADVHLQVDRIFASHNAIEASLLTRNPGMFKTLIDASGVDVNLQIEGRKGTVLAYAASRWSTMKDVVAFLVLDKGANVNLQIENGDYGSTLVAAVKETDEAAIPGLTKLGADVNMQVKHGLYGSALATAACFGFTWKCRILVEVGAQIDMQITHGPVRQRSRCGGGHENRGP